MAVNKLNLERDGLVVGATQLVASGGGVTIGQNLAVGGNVYSTNFIGNGALLTGIIAGSNYSNIQVATYLPTYTGTIGASFVNSTGNVSDSKGDVRSAPINSQGGAYAAVAADAGKTIYISTGGVTINASIFNAGDMVTIVNNSASNQTITAGGSVTFRLAGTGTTGNRTLAQYGMATFLCVVGGATPTFHCSGAGLS